MSDKNSNDAPPAPVNEKSTPLFDTRIVIFPVACAGVSHIIARGEMYLAMTITLSKAHDKAVEFSKPVPERVTRVPPCKDPREGETDVTLILAW
jgi:hypothetical protein